MLPDTLPWSPNRCDTAVSGMRIRGDGFAEPITVHPVAMRPHIHPDNTEECHYHTGHVAMSRDGKVRVVHGVKADNQEDNENSIGYPVIATQAMCDAQPGMFRKGFAYFVGGYKTPEVVEAIAWSMPQRCGDSIS